MDRISTIPPPTVPPPNIPRVTVSESVADMDRVVEVEGDDVRDRPRVDGDRGAKVKLSVSPREKAAAATTDKWKRMVF